MKEKLSIIIRQRLILSNVQWTHLIGKKRFPVLMLTRWSLFFITLLWINYIILFLVRRSYLRTETLLGWTKKSKKYFRRNNNDRQLLDRLKDIQTQLNFLIEKSKTKHYSRITSKSSDISKSSKTYWPILKSFLIGKKVHVFHRYLKTMNILQISRKKRNYSIHFLQTSAP